MASQQKVVGGMTDPQEADSEVQGYANEIKSKVEEAIGRSTSKYEVKTYRSQVVNGVNYFIKIDTGDGKFVHVRFHRSFQGEVTHVRSEDGKTESDELQYMTS